MTVKDYLIIFAPPFIMWVLMNTSLYDPFCSEEQNKRGGIEVFIILVLFIPILNLLILGLMLFILLISAEPDCTFYRKMFFISHRRDSKNTKNSID